MSDNKSISVPGDGDDISATIEAYRQHQLLMKLPEALKGGTKAMRAAKEEFLPKEKGETQDSYDRRLKRSILVNYYWSTICKTASDVFREDVEASDDLPDEVAELLDNIDQRGNSATAFLAKIMRVAMHKGVNHIMVEYPQVEGSTKKDHKDAGARPYWVEINPSDVIGWRVETKNGAPFLTQLRVKETIEVNVGKYGTEKKDRIRLYEPGYWAVFEEGAETGGWGIATDADTGNPMQGNTSLDFIPLVTIMLGEELTEMTAEPCFLDLAELNSCHWQSNSDQRNILHYARMITYFGKQLDVDADTGKINMGANVMVHSTSENADLKVVEHSGKGIEAGRNDLKDLETAMEIFGLSLIMPKSGSATATEKAINKSESDSILGGWVRTLDSCLQTLVEYTCKFLAIEAKGTIKASINFKALWAAVDAGVLIEGFKSGLLPRQLVFDELKSRGVITQDIDMIELIAMFEEDRRNSDLFGTSLQSSQNPDNAESQDQSLETDEE